MVVMTGCTEHYTAHPSVIKMPANLRRIFVLIIIR